MAVPAGVECGFSCKVCRAVACGQLHRIGVRTRLRQAGRFRSRTDRLELEACCFHRGLHARAGGENVERTTSLCRVATAWECAATFRSGAQAAETGMAVKGRSKKGLGHFAGRWRRRSGNVARQVQLQRECNAQLQFRLRSVPYQRVDREHARQCCRHL